MDWLPQTKLHPPLLRDDLIPREGLLQTLHAALLAHPLTLLSAPAGYGKTTLLAALASKILDTGDWILQDNFPISNTQYLQFAWLTLDEEDNDPVHFLSALVAALGGLNPACGVTAQTLLQSSFNPIALEDPDTQLRRVVGVLVNEVLETLPAAFVLALDDLHLNVI